MDMVDTEACFDPSAEDSWVAGSGFDRRGRWDAEVAAAHLHRMQVDRGAEAEAPDSRIVVHVDAEAQDGDSTT